MHLRENLQRLYTEVPKVPALCTPKSLRLDRPVPLTTSIVPREVPGTPTSSSWVRSDFAGLVTRPNVRHGRKHSDRAAPGLTPVMQCFPTLLRRLGSRILTYHALVFPYLSNKRRSLPLPQPPPTPHERPSTALSCPLSLRCPWYRNFKLNIQGTCKYGFVFSSGTDRQSFESRN